MPAPTPVIIAAVAVAIAITRDDRRALAVVAAVAPHSTTVAVGVPLVELVRTAATVGARRGVAGAKSISIRDGGARDRRHHFNFDLTVVELAVAAATRCRR